MCSRSSLSRGTSVISKNAEWSVAGKGWNTREVEVVVLWRRVRGRWSILKRRLLVGLSFLFSFPFQKLDQERIDSSHCLMILDSSLIGYTKTCGLLVIVRRVVAARQHAAGKPAAVPHRNQGLLSHAHSASRMQPLLRYGEKETDSSDFPERPGAKKTKRGGFWARFRCW